MSRTSIFIEIDDERTEIKFDLLEAHQPGQKGEEARGLKTEEKKKAKVDQLQMNEGASPSQKINLEKLMPRWEPQEISGSEKIESKSAGNYDRYSQTGSFGTMNAMGLEEYAPMIPYFQALWDKIDQNFGFPEDFVKQRLTGAVSLDLLLNEKGVFQGEFLALKGQDTILQTYVVALVLHLLKKPLPKRVWLKEKGVLPINLTFVFETYQIHGDGNEDRGSHLKNSLVFIRSKYVDPKVNEVIKNFYTRYFPPIIPIPGGVYIDFVMAYEMIRGLNEETESVKRTRRLKLLKQQLELSIKRENEVN